MSDHPKALPTGTVERAGSLLRYWATGPASAPVVVCSHGVTLDQGTYDGQVPALVDAGYRVITWDMRGHGASQPMGDRFSIQATVDDLRAVLDAADVAEAVLVGQSFGGSANQEFYRQHPERVAALVLVGAPALGDPLPWHQRLMSRTRPTILRLWPERSLRAVLPTFMSQKEHVQRYVAQATLPLSKADMIAVTEAALEGLLAYQPLEQIGVPVLLTRGVDEMAAIARMIDAWAESDPGVQVAVVEDAGHLVNQDSPAAFNPILLRFLQQVAPAT